MATIILKTNKKVTGHFFMIDDEGSHVPPTSAVAWMAVPAGIVQLTPSTDTASCEVVPLAVGSAVVAASMGSYYIEQAISVVSAIVGAGLEFDAPVPL